MARRVATTVAMPPLWQAFLSSMSVSEREALVVWKGCVQSPHAPGPDRT
jgi:hypothetical protein